MLDILPSPVGSQMSLTQRGSLGRRTYDVTLARRADEGFGFVIISSVTQTDTVIGECEPEAMLQLALSCTKVGTCQRVSALTCR
jgi:hypothetical protein